VVTSQKVNLYIDPRTYLHSPQYVLTVAPTSHRVSVHLVLTRHHTGETHHITSRTGSVDSYKRYLTTCDILLTRVQHKSDLNSLSDDYMTLHVFENGGKRINDIYDGRCDHAVCVCVCVCDV
jgi:hypothetical protein